MLWQNRDFVVIGKLREKTIPITGQMYNGAIRSVTSLEANPERERVALSQDPMPNGCEIAGLWPHPYLEKPTLSDSSLTSSASFQMVDHGKFLLTIRADAMRAASAP